MENPDYISESWKPFFAVKILKFFDADPGFRSGIQYPGLKKRIGDPG